jgi:hypothetical protein
MGPFFVPIIIVAVTGFLGALLWVAQRGGPEADPETGTYLFRHSWLFRGFSLFAAFGIPLGITLLVIFNPPKHDGDLIAIVFIYALFAVLSFPLLWESVRFAVLVTPEGVYCKSPWRASRFLDWSEIRELDFSPTSSWFILRATDGWKFRIYTLVPGLKVFLEECEKHLPVEALRKAKAGYLRVGRPFPGDPEPGTERTVDVNELIRRAREKR